MRARTQIIGLAGYVMSALLAGGAAAQQPPSVTYQVNTIAMAPGLRLLPLPSDLEPTPPLMPAATSRPAQNGATVIVNKETEQDRLYQVSAKGRLAPYLGLGGASAKVDPAWLPTPSSTAAAEPVQGYQGVAGVAYNFDRNVQFNLGYRYSNLRPQDGPVPEDTEIDRQSHDSRAMLLFRYELGGDPDKK